MNKPFRAMAAAAVLALAVPSAATKYAGEFMYIGAGGRALGMGGAYASLAADATAGYWNPAGLVRMTGSEAQLMHSERFGGLVTYDYLAYGRSDGETGLGASLFRTDMGDVPNTTDMEYYDTGSDGVFGEDGTGEPGDAGNDDYDPETNPDGTEGNGEWDPGEEIIYDESRISYQSCVDWALYLSWSRHLTDRLTLGTSAKVISRTIMDHSGWGLGFDAGAQMRFSDAFSVGLTLQDVFGTYLFYDTGTRESVLPTAKLGMSAQWPIRRFASVLTFSMDGDFRFEGRKASAQYHMGEVSLDTHMGFELMVKDRVGLRLGGSEGNLTAGLGLRLGLMGRPVSLDYAYLSHEELDNTHRFSLGVGF